MCTLEEKLQGDCRYESDNQAKQITPRKGDVPRKGAEEMFIRMFETMCLIHLHTQTTAKCGFKFVLLLFFTGSVMVSMATYSSVYPLTTEEYNLLLKCIHSFYPIIDCVLCIIFLNVL